MKIMIAILNQGPIHSKLAEPLLNLVTEHEVQFLFSDERPIDYNRNCIVDKFLETDCEILFMLDSDMIIDKHLLDMIKPDYDVVSAVTFSCKKGIPYPLIMKLSQDGKSYQPMFDPVDELTEYTEVDGIGTGCIYIRRNVFDKIQKPYFRFQYAEDGHIELGEDYAFSAKVKKSGVKLYVATKFIVGHSKTFDAAHINQIIYKGLTFNKDGIAKVLSDRLNISAANKISKRLKDGT